MSDEPRIHGPQVKLFLGALLSTTAVGKLGETVESMRRAAYDAGYQVHWVPPVNYHVTLKYLGNTQPEMISVLRDRLTPEMAEQSRFSFSTTGFGAFPELADTRVLWAGVQEPSGQLAAVAERCELVARSLGFVAESRAYHPHVTVGRLSRPDDLTSVVQEYTERTFSKTRVNFIVLFESVMKSGILKYVERARFGLGDALKSTKRQTSTLQPSTHREADELAPGSPASAPAIAAHPDP